MCVSDGTPAVDEFFGAAACPVEQGRLAHPGFPSNEERAAARADVAQEVVDRPELALAAEQRGSSKRNRLVPHGLSF
jgi:hypothetical protein